MSTASPSLPVRVLLADMSRMTREVIGRILEQEPGVEVVVSETHAGASPFRQLIENTEADVVIVGTEERHLLAECRELIDDRAPVRVLAVSGNGQEAHLYGVRRYEMVVEEFSPGFLLEVVRPESVEKVVVATAAAAAGSTAQGGFET